MKIGIVNNSFSLGGAEKMAYELGMFLSKNNEVNFISLDSKLDVNFEFTNNLLEINMNILDRFLQKISRELYNYFKLSYTIKFIKPVTIARLKKILLKEKYDIVILNQGELTAMLPYLKKKLKTKFIVWQHSNFDIYVNNYNVRYLKSYIQGLEKADTVVCLTHEDEKKFKKYNKKTECINNFIISDFNKISKLKEKNVVFVSRLIKETKGLDLLIDIIKKTDYDIKFVIVGDGPDRSWLENKIKEKNLTYKVKSVGKQKGNSLIDIYTNGSLFISTSRWEGFSLVIAEAMSYGLPIVSTNTIGANEVLGNGDFGILISEEDTDKFSAEINRVFEDSKLKKNLSILSLQRSKDFSIDVILPLWVELLNEL